MSRAEAERRGRRAETIAAWWLRLQGWRIVGTRVRTPVGDRRTPDEDGGIMVLLTPTTPVIVLDAPISCEWRPGDVW